MTRTLTLAFLILFVTPLLTHAVWWQMQGHPRSWSDASWTSAGILPPAREIKGPVVHVLAGRTGRWKGIFAHHTWVVVKGAGDNSYTRYDVVGWGSPVRRNGWDADGRWYGGVPQVLLTLEGAAAARALPHIAEAIKTYPYLGLGTYKVWPGPNSNTFIAHIARHVPELAPALLPTAIGKDFVGWPLYAGATPSHTGVQLSVGGLAGFSIGWVEGLEIDLFGLVAGLDVRRPALKLPGWGRIGLSVEPAYAAAPIARTPLRHSPSAAATSPWDDSSARVGTAAVRETKPR